ncbi:hypothetical protein [Nocardia farcinica]|uniref:hypothetical protein n=1 Tax=Nocardia farcinica TaxID=37329 RepID=UPI002456C3F2|nr:hypothetical protein [Nocardia farcinica]
MASGRYADHLKIVNQRARIREEGREITSDDICDAIAELESLVRPTPKQTRVFSLKTDENLIVTNQLGERLDNQIKASIERAEAMSPLTL